MGKGGIVRDPELHQAACDRVRALVEALGFCRRHCSKARSSGRKAIGNFCCMHGRLNASQVDSSEH